MKTVENSEVGSVAADEPRSKVEPRFEVKAINVKRTGVTLNPDRSRVLVRPFRLATNQRTTNICARVMALSESEVRELLREVMTEFNDRHQQTKDLLKSGFDRVKTSLLT